MKCFDSITERLKAMPGTVSMYFKDLTCGETLTFNPDASLIAASVIKLPLLGEAYRRFEAGEWQKDTLVKLRAEDKVPSCGALTYLHDGLEITLRDLCVLMVILSDNTATNILFDMTGPGAINRFLKDHGITGMDFNRRMFDDEASARGIQNHITARAVGALLEKLYTGTLVSPAADAEMISIMKDQRLNSKIPFYIDDDIAHKTGEDTGTSHDAAIVYGKKPFILCLFSNDTDVPRFEHLMQDIARDIYTELNN